MNGSNWNECPPVLKELSALSAQIGRDSRAIVGGKVMGRDEFEWTARRLAASCVALIEDMPEKMKPLFRAWGFPMERPGGG